MSEAVMLALVGLAGTVIGALLGNWDKVFSSKKIVTAEYEGYTPTGQFETEWRIYTALSGMQTNLQMTVGKMLEGLLASAGIDLAQHPDGHRATTILNEEVTDFVSKALETVIPVAKKYFTVSQVQQLNKFYSTKPMQEMLEKTPLLFEEVNARVQMLGPQFGQRIGERLESLEAEQRTLSVEGRAEPPSSATPTPRLP